MSGGPLDGVRVVDLTTVVVGPICTRTLADYGAQVIKVEAPGGDLLRTMAQGSRNPGMSGKFINFNRNKRSIVLDIKKTEGLAALHRLIEKADVFVSNVRPEALTRAFPTPRHAVSYIMDTFPIVKRKDETKHGHYRTKETILQIYDALGEAMQVGVPYQTLLSPPPADAACCHPPKA